MQKQEKKKVKENIERPFEKVAGRSGKTGITGMSLLLS